MPDQTTRTRSLAAGQLALELPSALPALAMEPEWQDQARLWGHSLHPMCSYLASFPASLVHAFIARYSRPGDVVFDPFSGRGTAPLQAAAEGRIGVGNDLNPLAHVLTAAKLEPATPAEARTRLAALRLAWAADAPAWLALAERAIHRPRTPVRIRARRGQRRGTRRPHGTPPRRGRPRVPPAHAGPAAPGPVPPAPRRPHGPVPRGRARGRAARQDPVLPVHHHAQHVQHGPALRPGLRGEERLRAAGPGRVRRPLRQARPPLSPAAALDHRRRAAGRCPDGRPPCPDRAASPRPARPGPPRDHVAAVPARAQVRLLQLAADVAAGLRRPRHRRHPGRRPPPGAVPRVPAGGADGPPAGDGGRRDRRGGDRRRGDGPRQALRGGHRPGRARHGRRRRSRRATGSRAWSGTRWPRTGR